MELKTTEERELKCVLTDEQVLEYSRELAKHQQDKYGLESALAAVKADYKDKTAKCDTNINMLSRKVANGYEHRPVECRWEYNWEEGKKRLYRQDTFELVDTQAISEYERQCHLDLEKKEEEEQEGDDTNPEKPTKKAPRRQPSATA